MRDRSDGKKGTLYVVATPIGNLMDMTPRAVEVLAEVDLIAAEDTRHSRVLMNHFQIKTPLYSCHKFNEAERGAFFVEALLEGKDVALISDAGTPCISDPGHRLVALAAGAGIEVDTIPGANAVAAALSISGFDVSKFVFLGFLPRGAKKVQEIFNQWRTGSVPMVFYESPRRIEGTLTVLSKSYYDASVCLCNDLTKKFRRTYRGTPAEVLDEFLENPQAEKGEYTCVLEWSSSPTKHDRQDHPEGDSSSQLAEAEGASLESCLVDVMVKQGVTLKEAVEILRSQNKALRKNEIYGAGLRLKKLFESSS